MTGSKKKIYKSLLSISTQEIQLQFAQKYSALRLHLRILRRFHFIL
jgi:hypothetical protein